MLDLVVSMLIIDKLRGYYNTYGSLTVMKRVIGLGIFIYYRAIVWTNIRMIGNECHLETVLWYSLAFCLTAWHFLVKITFK